MSATQISFAAFAAFAASLLASAQSEAADCTPPAMGSFPNPTVVAHVVGGGEWRNVVMLEWKDAALSGPATIFSANGEQRLRDCSVRVVMAGNADTSAAASLQRNAGAAISSAANGKLANVGKSVVSKLQRATAIPAPVLEAPAQPHKQAPIAQRSTDPAATEYEAAQAKLRAEEKARQNRAPVPITPDMCVDGVCVEQDLGAVAANLNWVPPEPMEQIPSSHRKAYEDGIRQGMQTCEQANQPDSVLPSDMVRVTLAPSVLPVQAV